MESSGALARRSRRVPPSPVQHMPTEAQGSSTSGRRSPRGIAAIPIRRITACERRFPTVLTARISGSAGRRRRRRGPPAPPRWRNRVPTRPGQPRADFNPGDRHALIHVVQPGEADELTGRADLEAQKPIVAGPGRPGSSGSGPRPARRSAAGRHIRRTSGSAFIAAHGARSVLPRARRMINRPRRSRDLGQPIQGRRAVVRCRCELRRNRARITGRWHIIPGPVDFVGRRRYRGCAAGTGSDLDRRRQWHEKDRGD